MSEAADIIASSITTNFRIRKSIVAAIDTERDIVRRLLDGLRDIETECLACARQANEMGDKGEARAWQAVAAMAHAHIRSSKSTNA